MVHGAPRPRSGAGRRNPLRQGRGGAHPRQAPAAVDQGRRTGPVDKRAIVPVVERGGSVRSFHVAVADGQTVGKIVADNIARETRLHTDESRLYTKAGAEFAAHEALAHAAKEYARGDVHTNSAEGYFAIFKRGMRGV